MRRARKGPQEAPPPKTFGEASRRARKDSGVSLHKVALRAHVSTREAARWEADKGLPTPQQMRRVFGLLPALGRYWIMLGKATHKGEAMMQPATTNGTNGHRASASERLSWAKEVLRKEPETSMSGTGGLLDQMVKRFGEGASVEALHRVRSELREEQAREQRPLGASLGERAAAALRAMTPGTAAPPPVPFHPPTGEPPMARLSSDDRSPEAVQKRRARWLEIAKLHPDWALKKVNAQCIKDVGGGIGPFAQMELMAKARGIDPHAIKGRVTWKRAQKLLASGKGASNGETAKQPPSPSAPPSRVARLPKGSAQNTLAAIRLLVEAVPGIRSVTVHEDGSVDYTMREVIERKGKLRL